MAKPNRTPVTKGGHNAVYCKDHRDYTCARCNSWWDRRDRVSEECAIEVPDTCDLEGLGGLGPWAEECFRRGIAADIREALDPANEAAWRLRSK